jgi:ADP-ribose pyrophosphatase YjhB (NUDIX family)
VSLVRRAQHALRRVYWQVAKPRTFGVRAIVEGPDGRILLVKHTYRDDLWYLPGGGAAHGEEPRSALLRELAEEVGVETVVISRQLGTYRNRFEGKRDTVTVWVVSASAIGPLQTSEIATAEWFDPGGLPPGTSPGTRRRVLEFLGATKVNLDW